MPLLKSIRFPQYIATGWSEPQSEIEVCLRGLGEPLDVTHNNVVVSLRPLIMGVMLDASRAREIAGKDLHLTLYERGRSKRLLGAIRLRPTRMLELPERQFCLFRPVACRNNCLDPVSLRLYYLYEAFRCRRQQRRNPHNFWMQPRDLRCLFVFYICPRPVVLVSVEHDGAGNMFPMDLIGPTDSPWFSMALRSTSPAIRLMQSSKRMALASIPLSYTSVAYELGKHHKQQSIDWCALPFETVQSPVFGLPVPAAALRIREVEVREYHEIGSHVLFITSAVNEQPANGAHRPVDLPMFHVHGSYRQYLLRSGLSLKEA